MKKTRPSGAISANIVWRDISANPGTTVAAIVDRTGMGSTTVNRWVACLSVNGLIDRDTSAGSHVAATLKAREGITVADVTRSFGAPIQSPRLTKERPRVFFGEGIGRVSSIWAAAGAAL